jgi:hypothetical protein
LGQSSKISNFGLRLHHILWTLRYLLCSQTSRHEPGLVIDNTGLFDNSGALSAGQILWEDIENISVLEMHKQKLLMLRVKNPGNILTGKTIFVETEGHGT